MIFFYFGLVVVFSFLLIKATDILTINLKALAQTTKLGQLAVAGSILALATSLPELSISVAAAFAGQPSLALGNVLGANLLNLSLVVGGASLLAGSVAVKGKFMRQDIFYTFLAGAAPMLLLFDRKLGRLDGFILLSIYGFYNIWVLNGHKKQQQVLDKHESSVKDSLDHLLIRHFKSRRTRKELAWVFIGTALLLFSAEVLVKAAGQIAVALHLPILLVGLFLVSLGTTLPELAFSIRAIRKKMPQMVFGNILGSVVANGTLIIGLTALISPIQIVAFKQYLLATMAFVVIFAFFYLFTLTKHKLDRWEGLFLLMLFIAFAFLELTNFFNF
jgi:cation:H+ antiporter